MACSGISDVDISRDADQSNVLSKVSIIDGKIYAFTPVSKESISFNVTFNSETLLSKTIEGVSDFIIKIDGTTPKYYKVSGADLDIDIDYIIENGNGSPYLLKSISGDHSIVEVFGNDVWEWYSSGLFKTAEIECTTNEECETQMQDDPPYERLCVGDECKYVHPM